MLTPGITEINNFKKIPITRMNINGIWRGEYITHWLGFKTGREIHVPFVMKVKCIDPEQNTVRNSLLFEGIWQDDPEISRVPFHAHVAGALNEDKLFLVKQYPKLMIRNSSDEIEFYNDEPHPEINYKADYSKNRFSGTWTMNRTFRKINNRLCELMPLNGSWWMERV